MTTKNNPKDKTAQQNINKRVQSERIRLLYASTPSAVCAILISVIFLTYLLKDSLPPNIIDTWGAYMLLLALIRATLYFVFVRKGTQPEGDLWIRLSICMAAMTGLGWGGCAFFFFPLLPVVDNCVLALVIVAYLAGGLTTLFPLVSTFSVFFYPASIPLIFMLFNMGGKTGFSLGIMLIFFVFFVTAASRRLRTLLDSSLLLRFKNEDLVKQLQVEQSTTERLNDSLTTEVEERKKRALELITARQEAEKANQAKNEFLANMSHEIRTPMSGVIGMTQLTLNTELTPVQQNYLKNIKISADGLLNLLNDILDFSKIEAGQLLMENHDFNIRSMLDNIISIMTFSAKEKGLELSLQYDPSNLPVFVKGDELRLRQILVNLIGNGIKFTEKGSVTLRVIPEKRENNKEELHFMVIDTGIGIPADKQETIFSSFSQADSSKTRNFGGTGLGLSISQQLVEMMGGRIRCESTEGHGAQFDFTVVLEHGDEQKIKQRINTVSPATKGLTILLVEDNEMNRELARLVLSQEQHQIIEAENGLKGLEIFVEQNVDLILMDVQMPIMDGLTATAIIRVSENNNDLSSFNLSPSLSEKLIEQCKGRHIPIVAMTANAMIGDKDKCLAAGIDNYLTKPFETSQVRKVIADTIKLTSK